MNDLISKLGIDWKLLTAQLFNFAILLFALRKLVYKPVLEMLRKRRNIISRSIQEAKKIEEDSKKMEETKAQEMRDARVKAKEIVGEAINLAENQKAKILEKARIDNEKMTAEAKNIIRMQKEQMSKELEKESGNLALAIVEKYFKGGASKSDQEKIIKNIISEM